MNWNTPEIRALIRSALREDSSRSDITTKLLVAPLWRVDAAIVAKQRGTIAGLNLAAKFFHAVDRRVVFKGVVRDGAKVRPGQRLALIKGRARSVLAAERPALNALQHLSGIATFTHEQVQKLRGTRTDLYDTRKTLPGWRALQKYAVRCGGGQNHRMSLSGAVMIKDNHLRIARAAGTDWVRHLRTLQKNERPALVQMEIQTRQDLKDALRLGPERVLLDNLPTTTLRRMIPALRRALPGIEIEVTGNVTPESLKPLARLGPDRLSMGRLTHSVKAFDCSLDITHVYTH